MLREAEVIVGDLSHVFPARPLQGSMAMGLAMPLTLRKREDYHAPIASRVFPGAVDRRVRRAVADHEELKIGHGLGEDRLDREGEHRGWPMDRQQHAEAGHSALSRAARRAPGGRRSARR